MECRLGANSPEEIMMNMDQSAKSVIQGNKSDLCDKSDALIIAHRVAKIMGYCFAVETKYGWQASTRKPSLRYGKVIECDEYGRELIA
jgi:hypothetical protein